MTNNPGEPGDEQPNPFKGTPFEQLFGALGGGLPGGANPFGPGGGMAFFQQLQSLMQPHDGPLNWNAAGDMARQQVAQQPDPTPSQRDRDRVADSVRLADHWLDATTAFPSGVSTTAAWSRAEWLVETQPVWKVLVEPVAARSVTGLSSGLPEEMKAAAGPLVGIIGQAVGGMLAMQVGQGLGALAGRGADRLRRRPPPRRPRQGRAGDGQRARLRGGPRRHRGRRRPLPRSPRGGPPAPLRARAVAARAPDRRRHRLRPRDRDQRPADPGPRPGAAARHRPHQPRVDAGPARGWPVRPAADRGADRCPLPARDRARPRRGLGRRGRRPGHRGADARRVQAARGRRRRRAAGGPAEQTFAALVGLELRPRRLRDASTLWGGLRARSGPEARDGVWMHPDLLPTASDLDDPLSFRAEATAPESLSDDEFDAELRKLLDGPDASDTPTDGE